MIKRNQILYYRDRLICPECKIAEMRYAYEITSGAGDDGYNYKHKCFNCGYTNYYYHKYPRNVEIEIPLDSKMEEVDPDLIRIKEELECRYQDEERGKIK